VALIVIILCGWYLFVYAFILSEWHLFPLYLQSIFFVHSFQFGTFSTFTMLLDAFSVFLLCIDSLCIDSVYRFFEHCVCGLILDFTLLGLGYILRSPVIFV